MVAQCSGQGSCCSPQRLFISEAGTGGVYELRLADAHLPSDDVDDAMRLIGVDEASAFVMQGYQLLHATVTAIYQIGTVIETEW